MAKRREWFYPAQAMLKNWISERDLDKSLLSQKIGLNKLVETYEVWPKSGGCPTLLTFEANRITSTYFMAHVVMDGKTIGL